MPNITMLPGTSMQVSLEALNGATPPAQVTPFPQGATITYANANPQICTVTPNADGVTATVKAVWPGPSSNTDTISGTLSFTDGAGSHSYTSPVAYVTVQYPVSAIAAVALQNTPPA